MVRKRGQGPGSCGHRRAPAGAERGRGGFRKGVGIGQGHRAPPRGPLPCQPLAQVHLATWPWPSQAQPRACGSGCSQNRPEPSLPPRPGTGAAAVKQGAGRVPLHTPRGVGVPSPQQCGGSSPHTRQGWGSLSIHTAEGLPLRRALPLGDGKVAQRQQIMGALSPEKPTWTNREKQPPPEQKGPEASEPLVVLDRRDPGWAAAGEGAALALVVEGGWPRGPGAPETNPRGAGDPGVPVLILPTPRPAGSRRPVRGQPGAAGRPHGSHRLRSVQPEDAQCPGSRAGQWGTRV